LIGTTFDITREREIVQQLHQAAERLQIAERAAHFGVWEMDAAAGMMTLSAGAAAVSGFAPEAITIPVAKLNANIHPDDLVAAEELVSQPDGTRMAEFRLRLPDGSVRWCRSHALVEQQGGQVVRMTGAIIDVTEQKEMLEKLRKGAERMRLAEEAAGFGVCDLDTASNQMTLSEGALRFLGFRQGRPCAMIWTTCASLPTRWTSRTWRRRSPAPSRSGRRFAWNRK